ncbi:MULTISPECIES: dihydrodipicolinate synthase family protein [unclassified Rathayibacter]|uniref:dihydrodipicolinate synthase family protein n=1 Tax=unclassified Rathayibacter TaxID=2609250 RepID=UPI000F4CDF8D|nr:MULTISPECIES: dihydrodipicolinate synthase family protein [unclassified Rathayibacter]ROP49742.1 4-hydroxy-tetrahydrodipicolinate synthase [Rathayibacter sp. PhB186]ROS51764.1 4-hydroxy-tetrahydrodipicolinate synthase [Rathayibacter sp. PhB185]
MLTGLSAFPLTPLRDDAVDEPAFAARVERLAAAGVDSIGALGSTGSAAYLDREERRRVASLAVRHAGQVPVVVGISALRTSQVLALAEDAQEAGAAAVLLAPVSYQPLTDDDVLGLYEDVTAQLSVPLVVYDNPGTTHVTMTDELYGAIARLPRVASIKIPGVPADRAAAAERVAAIRAQVPAGVTIGVSGDASAARGLLVGCDAWYSVIGGTLPGPALTIARAAQSGDRAAAEAESARLQPLWDLFAVHGGSYRVIAAIAEQLGLVAPGCLPRPIRGLDAPARARVAEVVAALDLGTPTG